MFLAPLNRRGRRWLGLCLGLALLAAPLAQAAPKQTERSKQKVEAETTRAAIAQKLARLKGEISRNETQKEDLADDLAESEEAISNANRSLRELADEQAQTSERVRALAAEQEKLAATVAAQKEQLARLLRQQYLAGNEDRIKLLLSGDNPNRIHRDLQMMAYVSQAQARLLGALRKNLAAVEANAKQAQNAQDELEEIAQEERDAKAVLEKEKAKRAALLGKLSTRIADQRKQADKLERDEQRLGGLVERLEKLIKEQEAAAAAEKRRLDALAAARAKAAAEAKAAAAAKAAERERLAREAAKSGSKAPAPVKAEPEEAPEAIAVRPEKDPQQAPPESIVLGPAPADGVFAALKGKMSSPVAGKVTAKFGATRAGGGPAWKGVFIKAEEGADVRVVGPGRIVWVGYTRGFGNLVVVNHGGNFLTVYANNQSVVKRVGDAVKAGELIATVGNTGGNEESGLYFEIRQRGAAINPAGWVNF